MQVRTRQPNVELICVSYHTPRDMARWADSVLMAKPSECNWHVTMINVEARSEDIKELAAINDRFHESGEPMSGWNLDDNWGYARSCNFAAKECEPYEPDYLAFFNADVTLTPGAIDECIAAMEDHPDWGVLGPRQINSKGLVTHAGIFGREDKPRHRAWQMPNHPRYGDVAEAVTVSGSAYFVRADCWYELIDCVTYKEIVEELTPPDDVARRSLGAFLPTKHFFEETWCSYHARAHGWKVVYYGPVIVHHEWHQASPVGGWAERQFPLSQRLFRQACDKHGIAHD